MTRPSIQLSAALATLVLIAGVVGRAAQQVQVQGVVQGGQGGVITFSNGQQSDTFQVPPGPVLRTGTSHISGRVLGVNGVPIRQAAVRIMAPQLGASRSTITDQDGRYEFRDLPAGRYTVSVTKAGFVNLNYGQVKPDDAPKPVVIADGQGADGVNIALPRGAVIAGRVLDEFGEPVTDAQVMSLQRRFSQGQMRLVNLGRMATTNDIGEFRLYGLMPGKYYLSVSVRPPFGGPPGTSDVRVGYAPTYYPATASATDAQAITVGLGETVSGMDIALASTRLATVSGSAIDSKGGMVRRGVVNVTTRDGAFSPVLPNAPIQDDGTFMLVGMPPGEYILRAMVQPLNFAVASSNPADRLAAARTELERANAQQPESLTAVVTVSGGDISGVLLVPLRRITVAGRFTFDPAAGASLRSSMMSVNVTTIGGDAAGLGSIVQTQPAKEDFTFEITAPATEVAIKPMVRNPEWVVKAVRVSGVDVTDIGMDLRNANNVLDVEVELTNHPPEVSGVVSDSRGQPIANATIVIFPEDRRRWLFDTRLMPFVRTDPQGRYRVRTLPPGRYLALAMEFTQPERVQDPDFLEAIRARATPVTLADQEAKTLNFTVAVAR